jgi:hypothetical protein
MGFAESVLDHRHGGGIRLHETGRQCQLAHALDDNTKQIRAFFEPATHGGAGDRHALCEIDALLSVERQMPVEFRYSNVSDQSRCWKSFVDRLIWFGCLDYLSVAIGAGIFVFNVLEQLEGGFDDVELLRDFEAEHQAWIAATRASEFCRVCNLVFDGARNDAGFGNVPSAPAMLRLLGHDLQGCSFGVDIGLIAVVDSFTRTGERLGRHLGGALAEYLAVAPANLFFELHDALLQFVNDFGDGGEAFYFGAEVLNDSVAFRKIVGKTFGIILSIRVGHSLHSAEDDYILQYATAGGGVLYGLIPTDLRRVRDSLGRTIMFQCDFQIARIALKVGQEEVAG